MDEVDKKRERVEIKKENKTNKEEEEIDQERSKKRGWKGGVREKRKNGEEVEIKGGRKSRRQQ